MALVEWLEAHDVMKRMMVSLVEMILKDLIVVGMVGWLVLFDLVWHLGLLFEVL
jgi:hypothetical protein